MSYSTTILFLLASISLAVVTCLEPAENFSEGSCSKGTIRPVKARRSFVDTLKYFSGGSKSTFYQLISRLPNYASMREDEFYYDSCFSRNTSTTSENSIAAIFGFGQVLGTSLVTLKPGLYFEGIYDPLQPWNSFTDTVTLTDYKSFAVIVSCSKVADRRTWSVVTLKPYLDTKTQEVIESHAASLGFNKDNFVFLRHDSCRLGWGNPSLFDI